MNLPTLTMEALVDAVAERLADRLASKLGQNKPPSPLLGLAAAAERLGISEYTLRERVRDGKINYHRDGTLYLFSEQNLSDYLNSTLVDDKRIRQKAAQIGRVA